MPSPHQTASSTLSSRLDRNIESLLARRREEIRRSSLQDRIASGVTRFAGSMPFVYIHALVFGLWILVNVGLFPLLPAFDPSLVILASTLR